MTDATPAILSLAVIAAIALALGGAWLVAAKRDRRRGWLMIVMALVLLANVLIWAIPIRSPAPLPSKGAQTVQMR